MTVKATVTTAVILVAIALGAAAPAWRWDLPKGVAPPGVPTDNPMSKAKVELGRRLFYDADLSADGTLACATCHEQRHAFAEAEAVHGGVKGAAGRRNVMTLTNVGYLAPLTWADPSLKGLETQVAVPILGDHPVEMGMAGREGELTKRLAGDACYRTMFAAAFPETKGDITLTSASKAIAAFERTLNSWDSPYARYLSGRASALSPQAQAGLALFKTKGCAECHAGPNLTDARFHVIAPVRTDDHGLIEKTGAKADEAAFRTPSLRNVAVSAPYLHDGSARSLMAAIFAHEDAARDVTPDEAWAIEQFLDSLTDGHFLNDPNLALPKAFCGRKR